MLNIKRWGRFCRTFPEARAVYEKIELKTILYVNGLRMILRLSKKLVTQVAIAATSLAIYESIQQLPAIDYMAGLSLGAYFPNR